jgi:hypothetical protein
MNWRKHTEQKSLAKRRRCRRLIHGAALPAPSLDVELAAHLLSATLVRRGDRRVLIVRDAEGRRSARLFREGAWKACGGASPHPRYRRIAANVAKLAVLSKEGDAKLLELERRDNPPRGPRFICCIAVRDDACSG